MIFDRGLAQSIVDRSMRIIDCNINIMNASGQIIASGDPARIGQIHQGAMMVLAKRGAVEIDSAAAAEMNGAKPGVNLPLRIEGETVGCIGLTGDPAEVARYGELVRLAAETMLEQARLTQLLARDERMREELVLDMLKGAGVSPILHEWARRFGIDIALPRVATVIEVDSAGLDREAVLVELQRLHTMLNTPARGNLIATLSLTEVVVLKPALNDRGLWDPEDHKARTLALLARMQANSPLRLHVALGQYFPGADGIALSYRVAASALKIGKSRNPGARLHCYADLCLPVLLDPLKNSWQFPELCQPLARIAEADRNGQLARTLRVWFDCGMNLRKTADVLEIHRNTLDYRMRRLRDLCGLDLSNTMDCVRLFLALELTEQDARDA